MCVVSMLVHVGSLARPAVVVGVIAVRHDRLFLCFDGLERRNRGRRSSCLGDHKVNQSKMLFKHCNGGICRFTDSAVEIRVLWIWLEFQVLVGPTAVGVSVYFALVIQQTQQSGF